MPFDLTLRRWLFAVPAALMLSPQAVAQDQTVDSDADAVEAESTTLEPLEVTARRRKERAEEAPVALTVTTQDEIGKGKVDTLEDAAFRSPNTLYNGQGGPLTVRGVGSLGISGGVDRQPAVGLFVDDVFISRPFGYPTYLDDLTRVEVVRGSQATLYGKNTIGGAVNLITRDPGDDFGVEAEASLGGGPDFENALGRTKAAFDAPVADTGFGVRGFASWSGAEGYISNDRDGDGHGKTVSDTDTLATRLVVKGAAGDDTDLRLALDYSRNRDDGGMWYAPLALAYDWKATQDYKPRNSLDIAGVSLHADHDFGPVTLTAITALRGHEMEEYIDGDFTTAEFIGQAQTESQRQVSEDLRIASNGDGAFKWRGGLYYMHEWFEGDQFYDFVSVPEDDWSRTTFDQQTDTYSAFGEVSYSILPRLEFIGGLRYTYERKQTESEISSPSGTFLFGAPGYAKATTSYDNWSPEATVAYHIDDDNMLFAKYSRGFKSGGVSPFIDLNNEANRYDPELSNSYEIGAKTTWLDNRLKVDASLFYIDWKDQQAVVYTSPVTRVIRNAAAATSMGAEIEATARVTENLSVYGNYGYLDAKYDDFVDDVLGADYSGNSLPYAPRHSFALGARWQSEVTDRVDFVSGADFTYRSSYSFTAADEYRQHPTGLLDLRLGLEGDHWSAMLWSRNLLNEHYLRQYFDYGGVDMGVAAMGRSFGVTLSAKW